MTLLDQLHSKEARLAIVGLGYVGIPAAVAFAEAGFYVTGFDISQDRVNRLNKGDCYIEDITSERLHALVASGHFKATFDFSQLAEQNVIIIAVPTPLSRTREPDLGAIRSATREIAQNLQAGQLIILESTTYPGTTDEVVKTILEETGLQAGQDFYLGFSPERIDPGSKWAFRDVPKVVGGYTPACLEAGIALYSQVLDKVVPVSSNRVAEMTKLFENIYRVVNVALVNEMTLLCDRMDINFWEVLDAAATKPYGFMKFTPGPGVGGHCIPVDPFYLTWKAREFDFNTRFIDLAGEINLQMPYFVRELVIRALNQKSKSLKASKVLILGVAYKKDVGDMRESPAIKVIELLGKNEAKIAYNDPYVPHFETEHGHTILQSVELTDEVLASSDCVVILTDHSDYDYANIVRRANLIVDTRNATAKVTEGREKIVLI